MSRQPVRPHIAPVVEAEDDASIGEKDVIAPDDEDVAGGEGQEEEVEEAVRPQALRDPGQPTQKEIDEHELTHLPCRPWCKFCCFGKFQHDQHRSMPKIMEPEEVAIPTISMDYAFMGNSKTRASDNPILLLFDNKTSSLGAWQVYEKGDVDWVAREVAKFIASLGYEDVRVTLKSDGEPALISLKKRIGSMRNGPTVLVETPVRESKSNGQMESRIKSWQAQFRTLLCDLEMTLNIKIPLGNKIISWLVLWAATSLNKYKLDQSWRTAFQRVTGGTNRRPLAKLG